MQPSELGIRVEQRRKELGISQRRLAALTGVSQGAMYSSSRFSSVGRSSYPPRPRSPSMNRSVSRKSASTRQE